MHFEIVQSQRLSTPPTAFESDKGEVHSKGLTVVVSKFIDAVMHPALCALGSCCGSIFQRKQKGGMQNGLQILTLGPTPWSLQVPSEA